MRFLKPKELRAHILVVDLFDALSVSFQRGEFSSKEGIELFDVLFCGCCHGLTAANPMPSRLCVNPRSALAFDEIDSPRMPQCGVLVQIRRENLEPPVRRDEL